MSASLYQIAVRLTMVSTHGPVLAALSRDILGVHHGLNAATAASARFRTAIVGAATAFVGTGLLTYMGKIVDKGAEMTRTMDRMRLAGWGTKDIDHATEIAFSTARKYPSLPASLVLEMEREMAPVLGSRTEAMHVTDLLAQLMTVLQVQRGPEHTEALHGEIVAAVRAGELTANVLTDERFRQFIEMMTPSINAWGGLLKPTDFAQAFKYSRAAGLNLSDRFLTQVLPTVMQELGASSAGTSFMTMFQATTGGRMSLRSMNAFAELGLIDRAKALASGNLTPEGKLRRIQPGLVRGAGLLRSDPDLWAQNVLMPAMIGKGFVKASDYEVLKSGDLHGTEGRRAREAITERLAVMFGDRTAQGLMDLLVLQFRKIARDAELVKSAFGLGASRNIIERNYGMAKAGVAGSWDTLNTALALPNMDAATKGLRLLSWALGSITDYVRWLDPKTVSAAFIGIGTTLIGIVGGALVVLTGAIVGWPIVLGAALVGALAGAASYITMNWDWVKAIAAKINAALWKLPDFIMGRSGAPGAPFTGERGSAVPEAPSPGLDDTGGFGRSPMRWVPPSSAPRLVPVRNVITIDGHRIAEAVSYYIVRGATHVRSAALYDPGLGHVPVDMAT